MKLSDLLFENEYIFSEVPLDIEVDSITASPTEVKRNTLLIIPNSQKACSIDKCPVAPIVTVCSADTILPDNFPSIRVNNPRLTMANLYYRFENPSLTDTKIIGITGTNGKSSTALFIKSILKYAGQKVGYIGTGKIEIDGKVLSGKNYSMTTPDPELLYKTIKRMESERCDAIVMEVSSHSLALGKVAPLRFDYGIFTNLSPEHLDFHKNENEYFKAKRRLIEKCNKAIINIDDPNGRMLVSEFSEKSISCGILWRGEVWAASVTRKGFSGSSYMYHGKDFCFKVNLDIPGYYNIYNSMLAISSCIDMGIRPCDVKLAVERVNSLPGRFEIIKDDVTVVIDYAHTQEAFYNIMKELSLIKGNGHLCVVFGCGGERDRGKRPKMAQYAEKYADRIIVTTDNSRNEDPKDIIADIIKGFKSKRYEIDEDRARAIRIAITTAKPGDVIAVIGKGCECYNIDKNGYSDFNEKEIIKEALEERRSGT